LNYDEYKEENELLHKAFQVAVSKWIQLDTGCDESEVDKEKIMTYAEKAIELGKKTKSIFDEG